MDEKTALTYAITRALAYTENGGAPKTPKAGKTGEMKSIFQFTPDTWKHDAGQILGDPNTPLNTENELKVVTSKVSGWIDKGYTAKQIASMWNAGEGEPNAYKGTFSTGKSSKGVNAKYGVPYDVPSYADRVYNYSKQFYDEKFKPQIVTQQPTVAVTQPSATPQQNGLLPNSSGLVSKLPQFSASSTNVPS